MEGWLPGVWSVSSLGDPGSCLVLGNSQNFWVVAGCLSGAEGALQGLGPPLGPLAPWGVYLSGWSLTLCAPVPLCLPQQNIKFHLSTGVSSALIVCVMEGNALHVWVCMHNCV